MIEGKLKEQLEIAYDTRIDMKHQIDIILDEAKKELLTFKQFVDAGMMMTKKDDFSDIYSVYISRKIEKWFGE